MSSKLFGENVKILTSAETVKGTTIIVKALEDSSANLVFNDGTEKTLDITAFATVEGVQSCTWVSGTLAIYR